MATLLVLRERLRRADHLNLMREGWESWLFCRLQNSPYDCVFKYVRASSQTKGLERG